MLKSIIQYYKSPDKQVSIVCGRGISRSFPVHRHISYSIGMVVKGLRVLIIDTHKYLIGEGDVFIINSEEAHSIIENTDLDHDYVVVSLSKPLIEKCFEKENIQFKNIVESKELSDTLISWFGELITKSNTTRTFDIQSFIKKIEIFQKVGPQNKTEYAPVLRIREILDQAPSINHTIESLANKAFLSPFHFLRLFKKQTGFSPHRYLLDNRLRQAKELLESNYSVIDIAIACGFYDASHFIRHFIGYYGVSPQEYQKGIQKLPM